MRESDEPVLTPRPLAIGCMHLSTEPDRDEAHSMAVLHGAFDAGVTLLDTADVYCCAIGLRRAASIDPLRAIETE